MTEEDGGGTASSSLSTTATTTAAITTNYNINEDENNSINNEAVLFSTTTTQKKCSVTPRITSQLLSMSQQAFVVNEYGDNEQQHQQHDDDYGGIITGYTNNDVASTTLKVEEELIMGDDDMFNNLTLTNDGSESEEVTTTTTKSLQQLQEHHQLLLQHPQNRRREKRQTSFLYSRGVISSGEAVKTAIPKGEKEEDGVIIVTPPPPQSSPLPSSSSPSPATTKIPQNASSPSRRKEIRDKIRNKQRQQQHNILDITTTTTTTTTTPNGALMNSSLSSSMPPRPPSPHSSSSSLVSKVVIPKAFVVEKQIIVPTTTTPSPPSSPPPRGHLRNGLPMKKEEGNEESDETVVSRTQQTDDTDSSSSSNNHINNNHDDDHDNNAVFSDVAFSTTNNGSSKPMMHVSPNQITTRLLSSGLMSQQQQVVFEDGVEHDDNIINSNNDEEAAAAAAAVTNREEEVVVLGCDDIEEEEEEEGGDVNVSSRRTQLTYETELFPNAALVETYDGEYFNNNNNNDDDHSNIIFDNSLDDKAFWEKAESVFISRSSLCLGTATTTTTTRDDLAVEAAWDTTCAVEMNEILEQTKACNKESRTKSGVGDNSSQPLLQLENDEVEKEEATMYASSASAAKLLLQSERVYMYNNGGFGVGEDSSVDNDDRDDDEKNSSCDADEDDEGNNNYQVVDDEAYEEEDEVIATMEPCHMVDKFAEFSPLVISQSDDNKWDQTPNNTIRSEEVHDESCTTLKVTPRTVDVPVSVSSWACKSLNKIPPPPPEKLCKWEESKGQNSVSMTSLDTSTTTNTNDDYKIHISKSPKRSAKKSHSLIEELDLAGNKRMVKKIVLATTKAATKFEEQYPSLEHAISSESHGGSPEPVCKLTRGAFSPWKIPDGAEVDDEGSVATSVWTLTDNETNTRSNDNNQKIGSSLASSPLIRSSTPINECFEVSLGDDGERSLALVLRWLFDEVLPDSPIAAAYSAFDINAAVSVQSDRVLAIARDGNNFNLICEYVDSILTDMDQDFERSYFLTSNGRATPRSNESAGMFVDWLERISKVTGIPSPFGGMNPFSPSIAHDGIPKKPAVQSKRGQKSIQVLIFTNEDRVFAIFQFLLKACKGSVVEDVRHVLSIIDEDHIAVIDPYSTPTKVAATTATLRAASQTDKQARVQSTTIRKSNKRYHSNQKSTRLNINPNYVVRAEHPSPFEKAVWSQPSIVISILSFLGDPVSVCVVKRLNVFCNRIVSENHHVLMRDAVRLGGMNKFKRPSFWLWVTEMCKPEDPIPRQGSEPKYCGNDFHKLKELGAKGKWQHHIERDVTRSFGNMPPHKTGARYRQDSIVRALVSFGKETIIRNSRSYINMESNSHIMDKVPEGLETEHFKLSSRVDCRDDSSHGSSGSHTPTDTVSEWPAISPVGSLVSEEPSISVVRFDDSSIQMVSENGEILETNETQSQNNWNIQSSNSQVSDPVLSCNALTNEMKIDLQNKLRSILHALAARHEGVGYCQGMDYIVAHLLRVLQDTILLRVVQQSTPISQDNLEWRSMSSDEKNCFLRARMSDINCKSSVVEEVVFDVMDTFFLTYNLQHMYWPELRCLKTCCRVFENVIRQKLPVLADHFEHHDLNVGLFALGWFQTLFLYLPSMPSATVCHIWDIWLVERSFKIFFRVGTAILFLSQPTLLNHDLEGMMTYLNTFPDATLLRRDILIPCALQIKITNRMLVEIEIEVTKPNKLHDGDHVNEYDNYS